jgi:hypothetical protein
MNLDADLARRTFWFRRSWPEFHGQEAGWTSPSKPNPLCSTPVK